MIRHGPEGRRWPHIDLGWIESPLGLGATIVVAVGVVAVVVAVVVSVRALMLWLA